MKKIYTLGLIILVSISAMYLFQDRKTLQIQSEQAIGYTIEVPDTFQNVDKIYYKGELVGYLFDSNIKMYSVGVTSTEQITWLTLPSCEGNKYVMLPEGEWTQKNPPSGEHYITSTPVEVFKPIIEKDILNALPSSWWCSPLRYTKRLSIKNGKPYLQVSYRKIYGDDTFYKEFAMDTERYITMKKIPQIYEFHIDTKEDHSSIIFNTEDEVEAELYKLESGKFKSLFLISSTPSRHHEITLQEFGTYKIRVFSSYLINHKTYRQYYEDKVFSLNASPPPKLKINIISQSVSKNIFNCRWKVDNITDNTYQSFKYRKEGAYLQDTTINQLGDEYSVAIKDLDNGNYTFRITAKDNEIEATYDGTFTISYQNEEITIQKMSEKIEHTTYHGEFKISGDPQSVIFYYRAGTYGDIQSVEMTRWKDIYIVDLSNLKMGTTYNYIVQGEDSKETGFFITKDVTQPQSTGTPSEMGETHPFIGFLLFIGVLIAFVLGFKVYEDRKKKGKRGIL